MPKTPFHAPTAQTRIAVISTSVADGEVLVRAGAFSARTQATFITPRSKNAARGGEFDAVVITPEAAHHPALLDLLREAILALPKRTGHSEFRREWLRKIVADIQAYGHDSIPLEHPEG